MKYKGTYRLKTEYDTRLKTFPREYNGQFADNDIYIDCQKNVQIFSFGHGILQCYVPNLTRGNNYIKQIKSDFHSEEIIFDIEKSDTEVLFKFHSKHLEKLIHILKPKTSGAKRSPFSSKNLPKTEYTIPDTELQSYKKIISKIKDENMLFISQITNRYLKINKIDSDIKNLNIKQIEYIYMKNKFRDYLAYLKKEVDNYNL